MLKKILAFFFIFITSNNLIAEAGIDQWQDTEKTYKDLVDEGFEVKGYDTDTLKLNNGLMLLFFVTVLQKEKEVYECQEYQTVDENMQTLDMTLICRRITQPYKIGIGT